MKLQVVILLCVSICMVYASETDDADDDIPEMCPPVCNLFCKFGLEQDDNGCSLCKCKACGIETMLEGKWIGVLNHQTDTSDTLVVDDGEIVVTVNDVNETFVCKDRDESYSDFLWMTKDGTGYLCVWIGMWADTIVQYTLATPRGNFTPTATPTDVHPNIENLCKDVYASDALDIRKLYE